MKRKPLHLLTTADFMSKKELNKFSITKKKQEEESKKLTEELNNAIRIFYQKLLPF